MKLWYYDFLYLQESTVRVIMAGLSLDEVPEAFKQALEQPYNRTALADARGLAFSCCFKDKKVIEWINSQSWILDYGQFEDSLEEDVAKYRDELVDENAERFDEFSRLELKEREAKADEFYRGIRLNDLEAAEATTLLQYKRKEVSFIFPYNYAAG
ncbi:hypothetical protein IKT64_02585 [Candidatus Saccharibacteria bacterium]|nr:hypothetical protein [Candidatus Saccharibacteria bacterium]